MSSTTTEVALGRLLSEHRGSFSQGGTAWLIGGLMLPWLLLAPLMVLGNLVEHGLSVAFLQGWKVMCVSAFIAALGPAILALPILRWRQSVQVFERGLVHRSLLGVTTIRAEEVARVEHTLVRRKMSSCHELVVKRRGQRAHFITGLEDVDRLVSVAHAWTRVASAPASQPLAPVGAWVPPGQR